MGENTDELVIDFAKKTIGVDLSEAEIDRSHRVGNRQQGHYCQICLLP